MIVLTVKKEKLIKWYFDNWERHEAFMFVQDVQSDLLISGEYILRVEEIPDRLGYIPSAILEGTHDVEEYEGWDKVIII